MPKIKQNKKLKYLIYFLAPFIPFCIAVFYLIYAESYTYLEGLKDTGRHNVRMHREILENAYKQAVLQFLIQSKHTDLQNFINTRNDEIKKRLALELKNVAKINPLYDQIRLIDIQGNEILRVNNNNGNPLIVKENKLQNKFDRYYFSESVKLNKNELYISPIDLNIENKEIEVPYKPMIRIATPVFQKNGRKWGIFIINYNAQEFTEFHFDVIENEGYHLVLNNLGYFIKGINKEKEWGFMFDDKKHEKFGRYYPKIWDLVSKKSSGQFFTHNKGLFSYEEINISEILKDSYAAQDINNLIAEKLKIVLYTPAEFIKEKWLHKASHKIPFLLAILFFTAGGAWLIVNYSLRKEEVEILNRQLSSAVTQGTDSIVITNSKGVIEYVNPAFIDITGYSFKEAVGKNPRILKSGALDKLFYENLWKTISSGKSWKGTFCNRKKNGTFYWESASISAILDEDNKIIKYVAVKRDVTTEKEFQEKLIQNEKKLHELFTYTENLRETERKKAARNIHDDLGQILAVLKYDISWAANEVKINSEKEIIEKRLQEVLDKIDEAIKTVQNICSELRPSILDKFGLEAGIEWYTGEFERRSKIKCSLIIKVKNPIKNDDLSSEFFRIFQEALTNISRYAKADKIDITLKQTKKNLLLIVKDNGIGIKKEQIIDRNSFGLMGMKERVYPYNGRVLIFGKENIGTTVMVLVPLRNI
ncbi:MAG: PAS domain S-box protein [Spirochaetia bacterium]|nr:PAS domain S-box protein [Spirochaetia bacterium]